jgi:hypothetical protein
MAFRSPHPDFRGRHGMQGYRQKDPRRFLNPPARDRLWSRDRASGEPGIWPGRYNRPSRIHDGRLCDRGVMPSRGDIIPMIALWRRWNKSADCMGHHKAGPGTPIRRLKFHR